MKIIVLDNDLGLLDAFQKFLDVAGHECITTDKPVVAFSLINTFHPDVLISEYFSKDENYVGLFEKLSAQKNPTKIIILTCGEYGIKDVETLEKLGISSIFLKPTDPLLILKTLSEFEQKHRLVLST
jgi:DNA-binding NtrC family response regulator